MSEIRSSQMLINKVPIGSKESIEYIKRKNFWYDILIISKTFLILIKLIVRNLSLKK